MQLIEGALIFQDHVKKDKLRRWLWFCKICGNINR